MLCAALDSGATLLACSAAGALPSKAPRALLSDRRSLSAMFMPRKLIALAIVHPCLTAGEWLNRTALQFNAMSGTDQTEADRQALENRLQAFFAPWESPTSSSSKWNPLNPWPAIFTGAAHNFILDMCSNLIVWGLEEAAINYITDKVFCDDLTKDVHLSARRKLERGESKLSAAVKMVPTALKAKAFRYISWWTIDCTRYIYQGAKIWWQGLQVTMQPPNPKQQAEGTNDSVETETNSIVSARPSWYVHFLRLPILHAWKWTIDSFVCGLLTYVLPFTLLSERGSERLWNLSHSITHSLIVTAVLS